MKTFIAKPKSMTCGAIVIVLMLFANITRADDSTECSDNKYICEVGCLNVLDINNTRRYNNCMNACATNYKSCRPDTATSNTQSSKSRKINPTSKETSKQLKQTNSNKLKDRRQ